MINEERKINEDVIWPREQNMINSVLKKYGFTLIDVYKVRSAYKVICNEGTYCLKRMKHGKYKVKNGYMLTEHLQNKGFNYIANYVKTKDDAYYVKYDKYILYMTEWIEGEECNVDSINESINCAKLLAEFHIAVSDIDTSKLIVKNNLKNWPKVFLSNIYGLENFKKIILRKRIVNEFDSAYSSHIDTLYERGILALNILNQSNYYNLSRESTKNNTLCHDSFYYQNILKKDEEYYIIDLDSIIIDLQINDLGKFIRRLMYKKEYRWDFNKAKCIIEAYNSIKPISVDELEIMLALIIFPHKFWKIGKKRYIKHKHWSETKYMHKLEKIIRYNDLQDLFIKDYMNYIEEIKNISRKDTNID